MEFLVFQFVPIASCPSTEEQWGESGSIFFTPTISLFIMIFISLLRIHTDPSVLEGEQPQTSASPIVSNAPMHLQLLWPFTGQASLCLCLSCTKEPRTGPMTLDVASPGLSGGEESLSLTCWPCSSLCSYRYCWLPLVQKHIAGSHSTCAQDTQVCYLVSSSLLKASSSCSFLQLPRFNGLNFSLIHRWPWLVCWMSCFCISAI